MLYKAKVARVVGPNVVEVEISLGFNLTHHALVWLKEVPDVRDPKIQDRANHCLVVLVGGKKIYLGVDEPDEQKTIARAFLPLTEKTEGAFDGFLHDLQGIPGGTYPQTVLDVNKYLLYLARSGYDVRDAKERIIRGRVRAKKVS